MKQNSDFYDLITEICKEENINLRYASFGYITEMEKNGNVKHMIGTSLELNSASSFKIASDKFATYSVLVQNGIPSIKYNMVFNPETRKDYENKDMAKALIWFDEYDRKVILKANDSSEGKDVFYITSKEELKKKIIEEFMKKKDSVSICPFYKINYEYRAIYLDGEIIFCYKKQKPYVVGDGKSTLIELITNAGIQDCYRDLELTRVLEKNEKVEVSWKHNLSQGARVVLDLDDAKKEEVYKIAIAAGNAIGIRFASVDIAELETGEHLVMEINSSVCMTRFAEQVENGREIEKEIFKKAINRMFT